MKTIMGEEYDALISALEEPPVKAMRINRLKCRPDAIAELGELSPEKIPYAEDGYYISSAEGIGNTPPHHAGMIYLQDPGAMASLCALPSPNELKGGSVCDLCAAPGGKSGQAAAIIGEDGFLLSNEFVPKRAKVLVGNLERLGVRNAIVTSCDTAELTKLYKCFFDLVIADAPCSGEGMFRKSEEALTEWSEENVLACARRQSYILDNAAELVRSGGYLLYSTCTFSPEENEMTVDAFLQRHQEFHIIPVNDALIPYTAEGISFEGAKCDSLHLARRFYPHRSLGEGQFVALMRRGEAESPRILFKDSAVAPAKAELEAVNSFFRDNLSKIPEGRVVKRGGNLCLIPEGISIPERSVFSAGVLIGEIRGKLLFPSHQLFSAYGKLFKRQAELEGGSAARYLRGEELGADEVKVMGDGEGFIAMLYRGAALGGGKLSSGRIKNHYPKGLRTK